MPDKGQKELGDLLKEGAAALVQIRKGIENACTELRTVYRRKTPQYFGRSEQGNVMTSHGGANNMSSGNTLLPLLLVDKPRRLF